MPEWLSGAAAADSPLRIEHQLIRLLVALVMGICVAVVFRMSHGKQHNRVETLTTTLILLSVLIAMVSMVIGSSVALAFSLVGALSIVRFRTVVEDTRDTAFVIFAVVVGMAAGSGQLLVPLIGLPIIGATAIVLSRLQVQECSQPFVLTVRIGLGRSAEQLMSPFLSRYCHSSSLTSASTTKQGAAVELTWAVTLKSPDSLATMVTELNQVEGIQNVDLKAN